MYTNYNSLDDYLNNRSTRNHLCPICGELIGASCWIPTGIYGYMSKVKCPEHGSYYFFTAPVSDPKGQWYGCISIMSHDKTVRAVYAARDKQRTFFCKKQSKLRKGQNAFILQK